MVSSSVGSSSFDSSLDNLWVVGEIQIRIGRYVLNWLSLDVYVTSLLGVLGHEEGELFAVVLHDITEGGDLVFTFIDLET